jgi:predicted rRNA methylase YqxC with S4 and FtsJ domains
LEKLFKRLEYLLGYKLGYELRALGIKVVGVKVVGVKVVGVKVVLIVSMVSSISLIMAIPRLHLLDSDGCKLLALLAA